MLKINNLHAKVEEKDILKGLNLEVKAGEIHAIMGPNGAGKSTLASVLAGKESFEVTDGDVTLDGVDLLEMAPEERSREGLFLAFQYPIEIPGVNTTSFLKTAVNEMRIHRGLPELDSVQFIKEMKQKMKLVDMPDSLLKRSLNEGFSGGEKKRNEIFQMAMLEPKVCVLDETDSGLDIDALRIVANGMNTYKHENKAFVVITHYQRLLD